jgi:hypothetical protein
MSDQWQKLGLLYCPNESDRHPKLLTHAANPLPLQIEGDLYRIFYSARDASNRSSVAAVDIDIVRREIVEDHLQPFFEHGPAGSFYAEGVSIGCCYEGDRRYMLFMGWQNPDENHWRGDIGRLVVRPDLTLELESDTPLLAAHNMDPISLSYPWVCQLASGHYRMWYGSTRNWDAGNGEMLHVINCASSENGHDWTREGLAVPYEIGNAQAFSKPSVAIDNDAYSMWFSYRGGAGDSYRIGYARSEDGNQWQLANEEAGISVSPSGWDSEMIEYPYVFDHDDQRYMLYNGNGYGKSGFGLALLPRG